MASDAEGAAISVDGHTEISVSVENTDGLTPDQTRDLLVTAFAMPRSEPNRSSVITNLLRKLAETDPFGALQLADDIGSLRDTQRAKNQILVVWGTNDPIAALTWAETGLMNEPLSSRMDLLESIYEGYAANDPAAAFQTALIQLDASNPAGERLKREILEEIVEVQVENGQIASAQNAIELMETGEMKNRLLRELVDEWASFDPVAASEYVLTLGNEAGVSIKTALLSEWAENDPAAAAQWLSTLDDDDPAIARASAEIIRQWTRYDLNASAEWLNSLPQTPELDRAVASYTYRAAEEDPSSAMSWAESISNDGMRTRTMERVAYTWRLSDPEAFEGFLSSSEFTEEQAKALREAEPRGGRRR
ncbi:MAG: hypothetical protein AAGC73_02760 [Verrucomicrobiota bacterium]